MVKKLLAVLFVLVLLATSMAYARPEKHTFSWDVEKSLAKMIDDDFCLKFYLTGKAELNEDPWELSYQPFEKDGVVYMAIRDFARAVGGFPEYEPKGHRVRIRLGGFALELSNNKKELLTGNARHDFGAKAVLKHQTVFVPVESFCRVFGLKLIKKADYYLLVKAHYDWNDDDDDEDDDTDDDQQVADVEKIDFLYWRGMRKPANVEVAGVEVVELSSNRLLVFVKAGPRENMDKNLTVKEVAMSPYGLMITAQPNYEEQKDVVYPYAAIVLEEQYEQPIFWRLDEEMVGFETLDDAIAKSPLRLSKPKAVIGTASKLLKNPDNKDDIVMIVYGGRVSTGGYNVSVDSIRETSKIEVLATLHRPNGPAIQAISYPYTVVKLLTDVDTSKSIDLNMEIENILQSRKVEFDPYEGKFPGFIDLTEKGIDSFLDSKGQVVIVAKMGTQPSGGYSIDIDNIVYDEHEDEIVVHAITSKPGPNDMVTTVMTFPYDAVVIAKEYAGKDVRMVLTELTK